MLDTKKVFFIGVTRFSLYIPKSASWNLSASASSAIEYKNKLYAKERLDPRIDIFLNISLPQIALAAQEHNIVHIVQYSSSLPIKYKKKLDEASQKYDFLKIFCNDSMDQHSSIINDTAKSIAELYPQDDVVYSWYRLDDDDLLGKDFFSMATPYITKTHVAYCLSFGRGYTALYHNGNLRNIRECYRPKTSVGQLYICMYSKSKDTFLEPPRQNHAEIDKWAPTIIDSRKPNFITLLHPNQDGHQRGTGFLAIERIYKEQSLMPYINYEDSNLSLYFPKTLDKLGGKNFIFINSLRNSSTPPIKISTKSIDFSYPPQSVGLIEVNFHFTISSPAVDSRVFISFEYENSLGLPDETELWKPYGTKEMVTGIIANKNKLIGRKPFYVHPDKIPTKINIWHSRSAEGLITLDYFSISSDAS
ncbi:glycosyltransferase [Rothia nasimurium]|uniref:glycosyltransferase n=1 Tax=Rothia nasimurium TaxID=85336 RepID=UPI00162A7013|nr:glycosyltransferase [Rothia nasimurium]